MALLRSVLGTITQSMGGVTATTWKGKNVLKQKVAETNTSSSPAQMMQRAKFGALAKLGGLMGGAIRIGYRVAAATVTEQNAFYTANQDAVTYANGIASVDYTMLKLSTGNVAPVVNLEVDLNSTSRVALISWTDNSNGADALPSDIFQIEAYDPQSGLSFFYSGPAIRSAGTIAALQFPVGMNKLTTNFYAFFKRATSTSTSPSVAVMSV